MRRKSIPILFLTDYGQKDEYVGVVKCVIHSINPTVQIIDITHEIEPHSILSGIYIIDKILKYVPNPSVLLGVVDPGVGGRREGIIGVSRLGVSRRGRRKVFFVGPNNGLFTPLLTKDSDVFEIDVKKVFDRSRRFGLELYLSNTFHGRDVFGPVAAFLSLGVNPEKLAKRRIQDPVVLEVPTSKMTVESGKRIVTGHVIHIDKFGNIITNIEEGAIAGKRKLRVVISNKELGEMRILNSYEEGREGEIFGIIGSYRTLEISIREGQAESVLGSKLFDTVVIYLDDS